MGWNERDQEAQSHLAFVQELQQLGWTDGRNIRIDYRWSKGDVNRMETFATELVGSAPDAILAHMTPVTADLQQETRTVPIVFVVVSDPVGEGFVASLPIGGLLYEGKRLEQQNGLSARSALLKNGASGSLARRRGAAEEAPTK